MKSPKSRRMDMISGSLLDKMLIFALPLAASSILQQLFNSADVAVAGRFAGNIAQAAVGVNGSVISLLINLFVGLSVGANVVISNYIGSNRKEQVSGAVHTVLLLALLSGIFLLAAGQLIAKPVLNIMDTPADVLPQAVLYLRIYFLGMPFVMLYNFGSAVLRSIGDTRRPLYCLLVSGILNVILNLILVICFHMAAEGVAIATVVANGVSAALVLRFLTHSDDIIRADLRRLKIDREHLLRIVRIGIPAGIQGMVFSLSNICIQTAVNSFGSDAIAGSAAAVNFEFFTYFVTGAFGQATVTFTSQNFGAMKLDRCKRVFRLAVAAGVVSTGVMITVFILLRSTVIRFYTTDPNVIEYALIRMMNVELYCFIPVAYEVAGAALQGLGHAVLPAAITITGTVLLRFLWVYAIFPIFNSFSMLMYVYPVTWIATSICLTAVYFAVRHRIFRNLEASLGAENGENLPAEAKNC